MSHPFSGRLPPLAIFLVLATAASIGRAAPARTAGAAGERPAMAAPGDPAGAAGARPQPLIPRARQAGGQHPGATRPAETQNPDERIAGVKEPKAAPPNPDAITLLVTPSHASAWPGARLRVSVAVLGADQVGRFPVTVRFDPSVLRLVSVKPGAAWAAQPAPVLLYDASRPGEAVIAIARLDAGGVATAGGAELLALEFVALRPGVSRIALERFAVIGSGPHKPTEALGAMITVR